MSGIHRLQLQKTFLKSQIYMRKQYCKLKADGGLIIQNSTLNMVQESKDHQHEVSHNMKEDIRSGILNTLEAFNIGMNNQENVNPN